MSLGLARDRATSAASMPSSPGSCRFKETGFSLAEHDVFGNDDHVCALSVMGMHGPGIDIEAGVVSIFHYRDGRQTERWFYPEDRDMCERILET